MIFVLLEHKVFQRLNHMGLQVPKDTASVNPSEWDDMVSEQSASCLWENKKTRDLLLMYCKTKKNSIKRPWNYRLLKTTYYRIQKKTSLICSAHCYLCQN